MSDSDPVIQLVVSDSDSDSDEYGPEKCERCSKEISGGNYNEEKDCDDCERHICIDCVGVTGCQTTWGQCWDCLKANLVCRECETVSIASKIDLDRKGYYLIEDDMFFCDKCLAKFDEE